MSEITLEYSEPTHSIILKGDTSTLTYKPLFAAYARSMGATEIDHSLVFPIREKGLRDTYSTLISLLKRLGTTPKLEHQIENHLTRIERENERFQDFSEQASAIWSGFGQLDDFKHFSEAVRKVCTGRTLYRRQLLSAYHLAFAQNACNFSVPGAGKTSVVYAAYSYLRSLATENPKRVNRLLVVGPLSSFKAWTDEYAEIFEEAPTLKRISGLTPKNERLNYLRSITQAGRTTELTLTTYATLTNLEEDFSVFLRSPNSRVMMVLDEAHYIKKADGIWSAAALRLAEHAFARVVLTGTPAPNGYEDLQNLFRFIYPERDLVGFPSNSLRAMTEGKLPHAVEKLKSNIQPFYTRIKKKDLNLPRSREKTQPVPLSDTQEAIYRAMERKIAPYLRKKLDNPGAALRLKARMIRLRQAASNPMLLRAPLEADDLFDLDVASDFSVAELDTSARIADFSADTDLPRLDSAKNIVESVVQEQGKILVWSYFIGTLHLLKEILAHSAQYVDVIYGLTPTDTSEDDSDQSNVTRERILDRFHDPSESSILIANPQAIGESVSLHKACRSALYFDRDFNAGRFIQSKDRIHRYSSTHQMPVTYYYLEATDTIDADIAARLRSKEERLSELIDSSDIPLLTDIDGQDARADFLQVLKAYEYRNTFK